MFNETELKLLAILLGNEWDRLAELDIEPILIEEIFIKISDSLQDNTVFTDFYIHSSERTVWTNQ